MIIILTIALVVGIALAEVAFRVFGGLWCRTQLRNILVHVRTFLTSKDDDERQRNALLAGVLTLRFSLAALGVIGVLIVIAGAGPWVLRWDEPQQTAYFAAVSLTATGWWILRRWQCSITLLEKPGHRT